VPVHAAKRLVLVGKCGVGGDQQGAVSQKWRKG
jgi:hypothetical protein